MDPRQYESGAAESAPDAPASLSQGFPRGGSPSESIPATKPGPYWFYQIGESLRRFIVSRGLTPDHTDLDLLTTAITSATAPKASQAEVDAGTEDNKFVTPLKLRYGFASLFSVNGYVAFPSWLGGLIIQWGFSNSIGTSPTTFNFNMAFTSACYGVFVQDQGSIAGTNVTYHGVDTITTTTANLIARDSTGGNAYWFAIGK